MTSEAQPRLHEHGQIVMVDAEEIEEDAAEETTPLIGRSPGQQDDEPIQNDDGTRKHSWASYHDFKGLPWWKTPTVCCCLQNLYCGQLPMLT